MPDYSRDELARMIAQYTNDFRRQYSVSETPSEAPVAQPEPEEMSEPLPRTEELSDIGSLQVRVSTENQAVPLVGASVLVTRNENGQPLLVRSMVTDENGTTELIDLPTKDRALSLSSSNKAPYAAYTVDVIADGYYRKRFTDLPIYGGVTAIQSVSMIPLPEAASGDETLTSPQTTDIS